MLALAWSDPTLVTALRIIPVLDLKDGLVVRARGGRREEYAPIETPLSASADPVAVAEGLRGLYSFDTFYCADLDAIGHDAPNVAALDALCAMPDAPVIWLDAGFASADQLAVTLADPRFRAVLGTESQLDGQLLSRFANNSRLILSLDFFADGYRGPRAILDAHELWPRTLIVMTLARVGAGAGPDAGLLRAIKERAGNRAVIAAGGVRHAADVEMLAALGVEGVLMATALHNGQIAPEQLAALQTR